MAQEKTITHATGTYGIKSWDEKTWDGKDHKEEHGVKLTHAIIVQTFQGGFEGEGKAQLVMTYRDDANAAYVGLQHMVGRLGDRSGTFVLKHDGVFEDGAARTTLTIIPGSGTGELSGLRGEGSTVARHGDTQPISFDYYFE